MDDEEIGPTGIELSVDVWTRANRGRFYTRSNENKEQYSPRNIYIISPPSNMKYRCVCSFLQTDSDSIQPSCSDYRHYRMAEIDCHSESYLFSPLWSLIRTLQGVLARVQHWWVSSPRSSYFISACRQVRTRKEESPIPRHHPLKILEDNPWTSARIFRGDSHKRIDIYAPWKWNRGYTCIPSIFHKKGRRFTSFWSWEKKDPKGRCMDLTSFTTSLYPSPAVRVILEK